MKDDFFWDGKVFWCIHCEEEFDMAVRKPEEVWNHICHLVEEVEQDCGV